MEPQAAARLAEEATKTEEQKLADREIWAPDIDTLKNVFKFEPEWSEWGFVIFRATAYRHEAVGRVSSALGPDHRGGACGSARVSSQVGSGD
jgi:hypothetical protein